MKNIFKVSDKTWNVFSPDEWKYKLLYNLKSVSDLSSKSTYNIYRTKELNKEHEIRGKDNLKVKLPKKTPGAMGKQMLLNLMKINSRSVKYDWVFLKVRRDSHKT